MIENDLCIGERRERRAPDGLAPRRDARIKRQILPGRARERDAVPAWRASSTKMRGGATRACGTSPDLDAATDELQLRRQRCIVLPHLTAEDRIGRSGPQRLGQREGASKRSERLRAVKCWIVLALGPNVLGKPP